MESIVSNRLAVGMEIDKTRIDEIQFESEKQTALNKAVKYVSKSMKTQKEVVKYLKGKGYTQGIIDFVLGKQVQKLCKEHAGNRVKDKCYKTQTHNNQGFKRYKGFCLHAEGNGDAQQKSYKICKHLLRGFG